MWDKRYSQPDYVYGKEPNDFLASLDLSPFDGKVLCLAEGEGRNAVYLAQQGFEVVAVDQSAVGLQKAQQLAREKGVSIRTEQADLAEYAIAPNSLHGVVGIFAHFPPALRRQVFRQAIQGLKPGGFLILEAYHPDQLNFKTGGPPRLELLYSLEALAEDFQQALELTVFRRVEREVVEGAYHTGLAAVVQVFGLKPQG